MNKIHPDTIRTLATHWTPGAELATELRSADNDALSREAADELLARAVKRDRVELLVDLLAYEQGRRDADGQVIKNANRVRFRDGLMISLGRSGRGRPYLRDHAQRTVLAVSGRIVDSRAIKVDDAGHYQLRQSVLISDPGAVERALRGLVPGVSIGWDPSGPVHCTVCKAEIGSKCYHWPGELVETKAGLVEVEWEFQEASLLETSEVAVPAVSTAGVEGIRAALAALQSGEAPRRNTSMSTVSIAAIAPLLGLAATASETEVIQAARDRDAAHRAAELESRLDGSAAVDRFVAAGVAEGKIRPGDEPLWRSLYEVSPDRARTRLAATPAQAVTLVGAPSQSSGTEPSAPVATSSAQTGAAIASEPAAAARKIFAANGVDFDKAARFAAAFGCKAPEAALARHCAGIKEVR